MTKAKAITNDIAQNINTQRVLFRVLIVSSIILFTAYMYLIGSITFNVIARKSLESNLIELSSNVNQLDLTYFNNVNKIDKEYALSLGFVDTHQNIFVARNINSVAVR